VYFSIIFLYFLQKKKKKYKNDKYIYYPPAPVNTAFASPRQEPPGHGDLEWKTVILN